MLTVRFCWLDLAGGSGSKSRETGGSMSFAPGENGLARNVFGVARGFGPGRGGRDARPTIAARNPGGSAQMRPVATTRWRRSK